MRENAEKVHNRSATSTHNQREEEIERSCDEERKCSPVPIFPPPKLQNCEDVSWLNELLL